VILIALAGRAGAGKSTVGTYLAERYDFRTMGFAEPLKRGLAAMFGEDLLNFDDPALKQASIPWLGKTRRELMQTLGTEWGRNLVDDKLWLLIAEQRLKQYIADGAKGVAITDCRFPNEAAFIRALGGQVWHVQRPSHAAIAGAHVSERPLLPEAGDRGLMNDLGFEELYAQIDKRLAEMQS
jgi:hypothetical protein